MVRRPLCVRFGSGFNTVLPVPRSSTSLILARKLEICHSRSRSFASSLDFLEGSRALSSKPTFAEVDAMGESDAAPTDWMRALIRDIPDYPKAGIVFKDITQ